MVGFDAAAGELWARLGSTNVPQGTITASAYGMMAEHVVYEFKLKPFDHYDYNNVSNSTLVALRTGLVIGLDVAIDTRTESGGFGMLCANTVQAKWRTAANIQDYRLAMPVYSTTIVFK